MLDSNLAMLYQVETRRLNETVKRNSVRFPEEFCFRLTEDEYKSLRSQIATLTVIVFDLIMFPSVHRHPNQPIRLVCHE